MNVLWEELILQKNLIKNLHVASNPSINAWQLRIGRRTHAWQPFVFILGVLILTIIVVVNRFGILFIFQYFEFVNIWVCAGFTNDIELVLCSCCYCSS